jgi:hypothetical protein
MKTDMKDLTFLILVRLDSIQRLENVLAVTSYLLRCFDTNIMLWEADCYNNDILKSLLHSKINYQFIEDKDFVLHKTMYYNRMTQEIETPFIAIWDVDTIAEKKYIEECVFALRKGNVDIFYPYNGIVLDSSPIIRELFIIKKNILVLKKNQNKMNLLYNKILFGGAVILNRKKHIKAGLDNEMYYGWGNEDFERYYKYSTLYYHIERTNNYLFHLSHPRSINSRYKSNMSQKISINELFKITNSSYDEIVEKMTSKI